MRAVVVATVALGGLAVAASPPRQPLQHLSAPEHVPSATRGELRARMNRHANVMSTLVRAVVLIDRPTIATMAGRIADEELLARAESHDLDAWRVVLPKAFFVEQAALRSAARELAKAANEGEPDDHLADRFGVLTRTCVRCHGSYLHDQPAGAVSR